MTAKKYKPALFELVGKSPLKPDQKGTLSTPRWFYKHKRGPRAAGGDKSSSPTTGTAPVAPAAETRVPGDQPTATAGPASAPQAQAGRPTGKLTFSVSYWVAAIAGLALIFVIAATYRLGQLSVESTSDRLTGSTIGPEVTETSPPPSGIAETRARVGLSRAPLPAPQPGPTTAAHPGEAAVPALSVPPAPVLAGQCLIVCSHADPARLRPVQRFLAARNVPAVIGTMGNLHVLYATRTFSRIAATDARDFKKRLIELGAAYNREKPPNEPSFDFQSAFWANIKNIRTPQQ